MGPLANLKVIEMVGIGPCPLAGQLLADLGADVIVVDRTSGVPLAKEVNRRGKRSIALNLKDPRGVATLMELVRKSDVLIEGFRPGVMERLELGPDICLAANPRLIYGRMTGWGQEGPLAKTAGHDINYLALTGYLHAIGKAGEPPVPPLNLVADYGGGTMFLLLGVLSALFERQVSGKGQVIDAAMIDGVPAMMGLIQTALASGNWSMERESNRLDGAAPFYRCYKTSDEKFISVGALEPQFFEEFISLLELDPGLCKQQWDRSQWPEMIALFEATFAQRPRDEWAAVFEGRDGCVVPVLDFEEAAQHPHNVARGTFFENAGVTQTSPVPVFNRSAMDKPAPATTTGIDGIQVLAEAGLSDAEIGDLEANNVLL